MKSWTLALIIVMTPVTGWTQAAQPTQANNSAGLMSFFDGLFDGADNDSGDLASLLESFLGQAETANIDLGEILGRLEAIDIRCSITEIHHINKKDSPSGTALEICRFLEGLSGSKIDGPIEMQSHRIGNVFGMHRIDFELEFWLRQF